MATAGDPPLTPGAILFKKQKHLKPMIPTSGIPVPLPTTAPPLPIAVWRFEDAPAFLQELSTNGGDEDWLAVVPPHLVDEWITWLEMPAFGCCCVDRYPHPETDGFVVVIGSHA